MIDRIWRLLSRLLNPRADLARFVPGVAAQRERPRGRLRARDVLLNPPLVVGVLIVGSLFLLVLFGPVWAPENPYVSGQHIVPHYDVASGESVRPPLYPSTDYPLGTDRWGNDLLSLLMHGARNTLVACSFITMVRVLLGLVLGAVAGWNEGKAVDQLVMGAIGVTTSVPALISSMILVYALDIRRGLPVFIVALSAVGWTEIAQYIRSEFLLLRKAAFIEGARTVGLGGVAIAVRHVLPNVLPQLLIISFLEMAAAMMLLGELGFIGVYIGGGSRISVETDPFTFEFRTLIEVPEWGAMLADGYRWLRSRPFVIMPPAVAFFVSVVGFNALGEGLRRLVEKNSLNTAFLLRKRMLLVIAGLVMATLFILSNTGAAPWFAKVAGAFDGERAYQHVQALAGMAGRGPGQPGAERAATYIVERFRAYGLEPGWQGSQYAYPVPATLIRPSEQPVLALLDEEGAVTRAFRHHVDFAFVTAGHGGSGEVQAPLTVVTFQYGQRSLDWGSYKGLDLRERIVVVVEGSTPPDFASEALIRGAKGVLWVVRDELTALRSQIRVDGREALLEPQIPILRIRPEVADALLAPDGHAVETLLSAEGGDQIGPGWAAHDLSVVVHASVVLAEPVKTEIPCILGYKAGTDYDLSGELIVLLASYDGLGTDPDGTVYPAANDNASGVSILLELARLWQEQRLDARRSVLFIAWGGGTLEPSGVEAFLTNTANYRFLPALRPNRPAALVQIERVGGSGEVLLIDPRSDDSLRDELIETANQVGVPVVSEQVTTVAPATFVTRRIPAVHISWLGQAASPDADRLEAIDSESLGAVGQVLALALTRAVRQARY